MKQLLILSAIVVVPLTQAVLSDDEVIAIHQEFLSAEKLEDFQQKLRGGWRLGGELQQDTFRRRRTQGLTTEESDTIHQLVQNRDKITRSVNPRAEGDGVMTTTVSEDDTVVSLLHDHVLAMESLSGPVRQGDPLFVALFDHIDETDMEVAYLENGVEVVHTGTTTCGISLVEGHAAKVSYFVDTGILQPDFDWELPDTCLVTSYSTPQPSTTMQPSASVQPLDRTQPLDSTSAGTCRSLWLTRFLSVFIGILS